MKKRIVDIVIYFCAIFLDSFGIALMIRTGFGATPFGLLTSNITLVIPVTIGIVSLIYELLYIISSSIIKKSRVRWELLIYSIIFAVCLEANMRYLPTFSHDGWITKIIITLIAIVFIDFAKSLFNITVYPKLSTVEFIYAVSERYHRGLDQVSKILNAFNVIVGLVLAWIAGVPFNNFGIGTVMAVLFFGVVLQKSSPYVEGFYNKHFSTNQIESKMP